MDTKALTAIRERDAATYDTPMSDLTTGSLLQAVHDRRDLLAELDRQAANSIRPRAWIRGVTHGIPGEPTEYDEECFPGDEPPSDEPGWTPLYTHPDGTMGLLSACLGAMKAATTPGAAVNWPAMIKAIESHLGLTPPASQSHTTAAPAHTPEG